MSVQPGDTKGPGELPGISGARPDWSMSGYVPDTTPAVERLGVNPQIIGPTTGLPRAVFTGFQDVQVQRRVVKQGYRTVTKRVPQLVPIEDARYMLDTLEPQYKERLNAATTAYYGTENWDPSWQQKVWERAIQVSANSYAYGGADRALTPIDAAELIINQMRQQKEQQGTGAAGAGGGGVTTTKQVQLTNPSNAKSLVDNALSQYLGRRATPKELDSFYRALNVQEQRSPYVTTTTRGPGGTMSVTEGGFNPSTFAEEWARGQEGSAEFQAATTYLDAFIGALKARV